LKKTLKWVLAVLGCLLLLALLALGGLFIYINYEAPKTGDQKKSLQLIKDIGDEIPSPDSFSGDLPDEIPEIYTDQLEPEEEYDPDEELYIDK